MTQYEVTKTCWQCRGTGESRFQDKQGRCGVCHGELRIPNDLYPNGKARTMLRLQRGPCVVFAEVGNYSLLREIRRTDPRFKYGRIVSVLQCAPSQTPEGKIIERW